MKIKNLLFFIVAISLFSSCKVEDIQLFDAKGEKSKIQFGPIPVYLYSPLYATLDTVKSYNFLYEPIDVLQDTAWFDIYTSGDVSSVDRIFQLEQVEIPGANNAVVGRDYKAFDHPELVNDFVIKANQSHARVPIVIFRTEELQETTLVLQFKVVANDNFAEGEARCLWRKLYFSDQLMKPVYDGWFTNQPSSFGSYSVVKHRFMIGATGIIINDEYILANYDSHTLRQALLDICKRALAVYNSENPPLIDEFGRPVTFPN